MRPSPLQLDQSRWPSAQYCPNAPEAKTRIPMPREIGFSSETDLITRRRVFTVRELAAW